MSIRTVLTYLRCDWRYCDQFLEYETDDHPTEDDITEYLENNGWLRESDGDFCEHHKEMWILQKMQDAEVDAKIDELKESA